MRLTEGKRLALIIALSLTAWQALPVPAGLDADAWHLALIFAATILCVLSGALPIFTAAIGALAVAVLAGVMSPTQAYAGFSADFILLIVAAFLVAKGVVKSGLGHRMAWLIIARFGHSTLGLAYSLLLTDLCIAPAFPSNTARSGVLFPIAESLALSLDSRPEPQSRRRAGAFLMMIGIASLSISSGLWLTAMAANAAGVAIARDQGIEISFASWFLVASVPCLLAAFVVPRVIYRAFPPELHRTPDAPAAAREALQGMGSFNRQEAITAVTFCAMVLLWALSDLIGTNATAVAFAGLATLMIFGVFGLEDLRQEGGTLEVLIWFAILFAMSTTLNQMGFMTWLGNHISTLIAGMGWPAVYGVLLISYIVIHYFFVSQTAHLLALFPVYLDVGLSAGVPGALMAFSILFATNYFSALTPQASSANVMFASSGYLKMRELYLIGLLITAVNTAIIGVIGVPWILLVT